MESFGRYLVTGKLGSGSFATVYRAHDPALVRDVALKVLYEHLADADDDRARFLAEARALASLRHPGIVAVHDSGELDGRPFFTMELLPGRTLARLIAEEGPQPLDRALAALTALAEAIDAVHAGGFVHRDIKDANVMIAPDGRVTLMDFGIVLSLGAARLTQTGYGMGTPENAAPEQIRGEGVGPSADIYALGILAYQVLSAKLPFSGDVAHVLHAQAFDEPPSLARLRPELPVAVCQAIAWALAKDPAERPASGAAFVAALESAEEVAPPSARDEANIVLRDWQQQALRTYLLPSDRLLALCELRAGRAALALTEHRLLHFDLDRRNSRARVFALREPCPRDDPSLHAALGLGELLIGVPRLRRGGLLAPAQIALPAQRGAIVITVDAAESERAAAFCIAVERALEKNAADREGVLSLSPLREEARVRLAHGAARLPFHDHLSARLRAGLDRNLLVGEEVAGVCLARGGHTAFVLSSHRLLVLTERFGVVDCAAFALRPPRAEDPPLLWEVLAGLDVIAGPPCVYRMLLLIPAQLVIPVQRGEARTIRIDRADCARLSAFGAFVWRAASQ